MICLLRKLISRVGNQEDGEFDRCGGVIDASQDAAVLIGRGGDEWIARLMDGTGCGAKQRNQEMMKLEMKMAMYKDGDGDGVGLEICGW